MKCKLALIAATTLSLSACGGNGPSANSYCSVAKPIYLQEDDNLNRATLKALLTHNETGSRLCGWQ